MYTLVFFSSVHAVSREAAISSHFSDPHSSTLSHVVPAQTHQEIYKIYFSLDVKPYKWNPLLKKPSSFHEILIRVRKKDYKKVMD